MLHIASIPSLNVLADRSSESILENTDEFEDEHGNAFVIIIFSSTKGIEWHLEQYPDDARLLKRLRYNVTVNED